MLNHGLQEPEFDDVRGDFVVTFHGTDENNYFTDKQDIGTINGTINDTINGTINKTAQKIIDVLAKDCILTMEEVSQNTGVSVRIVKRYLSALQASERSY